MDERERERERKKVGSPPSVAPSVTRSVAPRGGEEEKKERERKKERKKQQAFSSLDGGGGGGLIASAAAAGIRGEDSENTEQESFPQRASERVCLCRFTVRTTHLLTYVRTPCRRLQFASYLSLPIYLTTTNQRTSASRSLSCSRFAANEMKD